MKNHFLLINNIKHSHRKVPENVFWYHLHVLQGSEEVPGPSAGLIAGEQREKEDDL